MEKSNLPEEEFRVMIIKMIKELGRRMDAQSKKLDVFNRVRKCKKKKTPEMKNKITEMKNTRKGINSRLNDTEEWICKPEDRVVEVTAAEQKKREIHLMDWSTI